MRAGGTFQRIDSGPFLTWWRERYGLPTDHLADHDCFRRGKSSVWIAPRDVNLEGLPPVEGVGIPFLRIGSSLWKPTTVAVVAFGADATLQVVDVRFEELADFMAARPIRWAEDDARRDLDNADYVIARVGGIPLACALWRDWGLIPAVPKGKRIMELDA